MVEASDETAVDVEASDRLGVLANQPLMASHAASAGYVAPFAALMADEAAAAAAAPCAPAGKTRLTVADVEPGAMSTVTAVAPENCASNAACTVAESAALSGLVNVICAVTAVGVVVADAVDATTVDAGEIAEVAMLKVVEAAAAAASPAGPGGKVSLTPAVDDPGVTSTATAVAPGNCASIAACTDETSAVVSGLANVI